jgi:hypothetical protein
VEAAVVVVERQQLEPAPGRLPALAQRPVPHSAQSNSQS